MKLNDLIFEQEGSLRSFMTNIVGASADRLGPQNPGAVNGSTVIELKKQLQRHQLQIANQPPNPKQIAWTGPMDGEWTQALSDAIIQWKKSINLQDKNARLDVSTPELSPRALKYLVSTKLYTDGSVKGLIYKSAGGTAEPKDYKKFMWSGRTFDIGHKITTPTKSIKNTKDFLLAIGESGWIAILDDFIKTKDINFFKGDAKVMTQANTLVELMKEVEAMQMRHPVIWLKAWEDNVLKRGSLQLKAKLASGNEMPYSPRQASGYSEFGSVAQGAQQLYDYFKVLATGILEKYAAAAQTDQEIDPETGEEKPLVMKEAAQDAWVRKMQEALYQGFYEYVPFIGDNDDKSVMDLMRQIRSAEEYDILTAKYNEKFGRDLNEDLVNELDDQSYQNFVVRNLSRLHRIRPGLLHTAIPFGDQDHVKVVVDGTTYKVMAERVVGDVEVYRGNKLVKNVILEDTILKAAIEQNNGTIPDVTLKPKEEFLEAAATVVTSAVQVEAAFMVPYYTGQTPFDKMTDPTLGIKRLKGLQEEAARMLQQQMDENAVFNWVKEESIADGTWLIGTKSVHWDAQWKNVNNNRLGKLDGILDEKPVSDEQRDLVNRLHKEDTRESAMAEILAETNIASFYDEIYRAFDNEHTKHFDEFVLNGKTDEIVAFVLNATSFTDRALNSIVEKIGLPKAAPAMMAKTFKESLKRGWWGLTNNDEELAFGLVDQIKEPEDYALVNEWYKKQGASSSLIDDLDGSEWDLIGEGKAVERLKKKLGINTELARAGFDPQFENLIQKAKDDPNIDNLNPLKTVIERNRTKLFSVTKDDKVVSLSEEKIKIFYNELTAMTESILKDSPEAELLFEILNAMVLAVQKTHEELNRPSLLPNERGLKAANDARQKAEEEWFN